MLLTLRLAPEGGGAEFNVTSPSHWHASCRRIPMEEVPESLEELNAYCYKLYERKVLLPQQ